MPSFNDPSAPNPLQVGLCLREGLPVLQWPHQQRVCETQGSGYDAVPRPGPPGLGCG